MHPLPDFLLVIGPKKCSSNLLVQPYFVEGTNYGATQLGEPLQLRVFSTEI